MTTPPVTQQFTQRIAAPADAVYRALLDPALITQWRVPSDMDCQVHLFEARPGGRFRISLTYAFDGAAGKTSARTDTYRGWFRELVPNRRVVEVLAFETDDPAMQGEMVITTTLDALDGGTLLSATHAGLPPGLRPQDNEAGWRESLDKLARLLDTERREQDGR